MNELQDKVVIVTGGAQGIGKGIVNHLLDMGARLVIADQDREAAQECLAGCDDPQRAIFIETDVTEEVSVKACMLKTRNQFERIDILINNAAMTDPDNGPIEELTLEQWQQVLQTNLTGCFLTAKHAVPHLRKSRGSIINIASTRAFQSEPNTEAYSASKGGVVALTHALAISLGPDIRVNCISPGWIDVSDWKKEKKRQQAVLSERDHQQHPAGRVGHPRDIAALVAFLVSDEAGFITGQNFIVDGGMTKKMIYEE